MLVIVYILKYNINKLYKYLFLLIETKEVKINRNFLNTIDKH